jgi:hypothetical protein
VNFWKKKNYNNNFNAFKYILQGDKFFRQGPNFFADLAEKFGQELATLTAIFLKKLSVK